MNEHHGQTNNPKAAQAVDPVLVETMRARVGEIERRMAAAARRAGRKLEDITLVAVSKTHPLEMLRAALAAGAKVLGESRIQEALPKIEALDEDGGAGMRAVWHLIGHLQTNKASQVVGKFVLLHAVDSARLIAALEARAAALNVVQPILLQINVAGEVGKFGAAPGDMPELLDAVTAAPHLRVEGLMTIPPFDENPEASRPHFTRLRQLLAEIPRSANMEPRHLSMGMSGDFEVAIEEGATLVRVGTAIFGERS